MNRPLAADSLVDFWSRRWNLAFRDAAALLIFRPLARRWGATIALAGTFLASGLFHEVVISLPARGGYGLPTIYFLIQFAGTIIQRHFISRDNSHWHLPTRLTTALVILTPLPLLFHPPFCERVIIPFLHLLGVR
jgi:D-alanyl-lipoteichoic acid acyltransferase DltB (MBOAT superfamily)